jgi:hypothetical protein
MSTSTRSHIRFLALCLIPTAIFIIGSLLQQLIQPYYAGLSVSDYVQQYYAEWRGLSVYDYDPAYVYLLNGVGLFHGYVPAHIDHPGSPLQVLTGIIAFFFWLANQPTNNFARSVIALPEHYLRAISQVLLLMNSLAIFRLGRAVYAASENFALCVAVQSGFLLLGLLFPRFGYLAPEALIVFAATMMFSELSPVMFTSGRGAPSVSTTVKVSFFAALGVASKVTFCPLLPLLLFLRDRRMILLSIASTSIFIIAMLFPIWTTADRMLDWFISIASHQGIYGGSELGFIAWQEIPGRLRILVEFAPYTFAAFGTCILLIGYELLYRNIGQAAYYSSLLTSALFVIVGAVQTVIVLKHFGTHYFLPVMITTPIVLPWCVFRASQLFILSFRSMTLYLVGLAVTCWVIGSAQLFTVIADQKSLAKKRDEDISKLTEVITHYPSAIVVAAYRAREANYAVLFGANQVDPTFAASLMAGKDNRWTYDRWTSEIIEIRGLGTRSMSTCRFQKQMGSEREILFLLPADVQIPELDAQTLLTNENGDRLLKTVRSGAHC